jgi:L-fuculose-phosphate aldolase
MLNPTSQQTAIKRSHSVAGKIPAKKFMFLSILHPHVHTHSRYATALACTGRGIPAFHYMVAVTGGTQIRCAPYRTFGSQELSDAALGALGKSNACLLGNHGVIALGADVAHALKLAGEVENLAAQYIAALALGDVRILDDGEMRRVVEKFRTYGTSDAVDADLIFSEPEAGKP